MSRTITLDPADIKAFSINLTKTIEKHNNSVAEIRSQTAELDASISGGQGENVKHALADMSKGLNKVNACIDKLNARVVKKRQSVEEMETKTGKFLPVDDILKSIDAKAAALANK